MKAKEPGSIRWMVSEAELDDEQYKIRILKADNYLIEGCAGSGKTVLALQKAKEIQDSNSGSYLVVIFTKTLRKFIEDGIKKLGLDPTRVCHFHDLNRRNISSVDYVIADEVQDFDDDQIKYLVSLSKKNFIFFGDDAQQIYSKNNRNNNLNNIKTIASIPYSNHKRLEKNYRLPRSIAEFAQQIATNPDGLVSRCVKTAGDKPVIIKHRSLNHELDYVESLIKNEGWSDVGILVSNNKEVIRIKEYYDNKNFPIEYKYDVKIDEYNKKTYNTLNFYSDKPKVMTYHSSKGLQFEHVFLPKCEVASNNLNYQDALYVATTRASVNLFISYSNSLSKFISSIPTGYYKFLEK